MGEELLELDPECSFPNLYHYLVLLYYVLRLLLNIYLYVTSVIVNKYHFFQQRLLIPDLNLTPQIPFATHYFWAKVSLGLLNVQLHFGFVQKTIEKIVQ